MSLRLAEFSSTHCTVFYRDRLLLRYNAVSTMPRVESPRSYFHPVHTLEGLEVTDFRPADHTWHQGISFAPTYVNDDTFWGGPSFTAEARDYQWLENHGRQEHVGWETTAVEPDAIAWVQSLTWRNRADVPWLDEKRRVRIALDTAGARQWALSLEFALHNISGQTLVMASPVCRGRPEGGYFGLAWRGAPSFAQGQVFNAAGTSPGDMMGRPAAWLAYVSPSTKASLLFLDHPANPRYPNPWFVRCADQPLVSFALAYHEPYRLEPDGRLTLRYQLVIGDGAWTREEAGRRAAEFLEA